MCDIRVVAESSLRSVYSLVHTPRHLLNDKQGQPVLLNVLPIGTRSSQNRVESQESQLSYNANYTPVAPRPVQENLREIKGGGYRDTRCGPSDNLEFFTESKVVEGKAS